MESILLLLIIKFIGTIAAPIEVEMKGQLIVKKCEDFQISGVGMNEQWKMASWINLTLLDETENQYETKCKMMYSETGIYIFGSCEDQFISTDYAEDQGDIWNGDVFEVFLQTDESNPLYFEYEVNQLSSELVILVPNNDGDFFGWSPWHYEGGRKVKKAVKVHGGEPRSGARISSWSVELFFPFALFTGLKNVPPKSGTRWKGNFYRMDYDSEKQIKWAWKPIYKSFHEFKKFGTIIFE